MKELETLKNLKNELAADELIVDLQDKYIVLRVRWGELNYQQAYTLLEADEACVSVFERFASKAKHAYYELRKQEYENGEKDLDSRP